MATIEKYCAPGVYDTPSYSQAIKVTSAQTILFLAGQVPYAPDGTVNVTRPSIVGTSTFAPKAASTIVSGRSRTISLPSRR
jgi:enamine deaminase RidA (YjgF/YER057c/UK114 family)